MEDIPLKKGKKDLEDDIPSLTWILLPTPDRIISDLLIGRSTKSCCVIDCSSCLSPGYKMEPEKEFENQHLNIILK